MIQKLKQYRIEKCRAELGRFNFEQAGRILEIGSGSGDEMSWCTACGSFFTAVEITSENCKLIKQKAKRQSVSDQVQVVKADGALLPFREEVFDVVFCKAVLHHIRKSSQAIYEMQRVTRQNGVVAAIDEPNALNPLWHIAEFTMKKGWLKTIFSPLLRGYAWEWEVAEWASPFYPWQLALSFKQAKLHNIRERNLLLPYYIDSALIFSVYINLIKTLENTPLSYIFGQLFIYGEK